MTTSLFTARRRAEEFAAAVEGRAAHRAGSSPELAELLGVVSTLRAHAVPAPRPEFARDLRGRLMAEAEHVLNPETANLLLPARPRGTRERRLVAAASAVVLLGGTASVAAAAEQALPGDALYPVKRGIERAEAGLNVSPAGKGRDLLNQASGRLSEVERLLTSDSVQSLPQVPVTLAQFAAQANEGAALLFESFEETRDPDSVVEVRSFAAEGIEVLGHIAEQVPAEAQDELAVAATTLQVIDEQAEALCSTCTAGMPELELPGIFLARAEVERALAQASSVRLNNDHPVVVRKDVLDSKKAVSGQGGSSAAPAQEQPPVPATEPSNAPDSVPSDPLSTPKSWQTPLLPGAEAATSKDETETPKSPGKVVEDVNDDLTAGLSGAVETLLPDTNPTLLP